MNRVVRIALLALIVLAGTAALVLPRLDEGPVVVCETGEDALVSCADDSNGRFLADSLVVAGMLASTLLVLRNRRNEDEARKRADDAAAEAAESVSG